MLAAVLWKLLTGRRVQGLSADGSAGHEFEDLTVEKVYTACHSLSNLRPFHPRHTLKIPTVSGLHHQIDVVVREGSSVYHLIECKLKQSVAIQELYATNAKLLDYTLGAQIRGQKTRFRGYFLSSASVNDNFYKYALAWMISVIASEGYPPLEYMLAKVKPDTALYGQLARLLEKTSNAQLFEFLTKQNKADKLLADWRACYQRWQQEGYDA